MPRVTNLIPMDSGRLAVILDPSDIVGDPGSITLWTDAEKRAEIAAHVKMERDQCAALALRLHGCDGDQIAAAIRERT